MLEAPEAPIARLCLEGHAAAFHDRSYRQPVLCILQSAFGGLYKRALDHAHT